MSLASKIVGKAKKSRTAQKAQMESLAIEFFRSNAAANAAKRSAEKARELLYAAMKAEGIEKFNVQDELTSLEAKIFASSKNIIDVESLAKFVSPETFIKIVSATQKNVIEHAGSDVAMRCLRLVQGEENVSVTTVK